MRVLSNLGQWFVAKIGKYNEPTSEKSEDGEPTWHDSMSFKFSPRKIHDAKDQPIDIFFQKLTVMLKKIGMILAWMRKISMYSKVFSSTTTMCAGSKRPLEASGVSTQGVTSVLLSLAAAPPYQYHTCRPGDTAAALRPLLARSAHPAASVALLSPF